MNTLTRLARAKINLNLRILGKRADGFHEVTTRMAPLALHDIVTVEKLGEGSDVTLICDESSLPTGEDNLMVKAVRSLHRASGRSSSWLMKLEKRIPSGAGLGGGSSDAAAVLLCMNELLGLQWSKTQLFAVAAGIGSDVPFFLAERVCDATGRGEELQGLIFPWHLPILLIKPAFGIATPWAYQRWSGSKALAGVSYATQQCPWGEMVNDLERPVFEKHLLLPVIKSWLLSQPETEAAMMSGSGATMFAVLTEGCDVELLKARAKAYFGADTWVCSTSTWTA